MITLYAQKGNLVLRRSETLISGSSHVYSVQFRFSDDWIGVTKTAVFRTPDGSMTQVVPNDGLVQIPWEVLKKYGVNLLCGVYGTKAGATVLPTVWVNLGYIHEGSTAETPDDPSPDVYQQILQQLTKKADNLFIEGDEIVLMAGKLELAREKLPTGFTGDVSKVLVMDEEEYEQLEEKDPDTLYLLRG